MQNYSYGRNYVRNTLIALSRTNMPFIIRGTYRYSAGQPYATYVNIRPYVPDGASTNQICDHLNIQPSDVGKYIEQNPDYHSERDYLICRAKIYETGKICRGGVVLTDELGVPPVIQADYPGVKDILDSIPKHLHVDFFSFAEGRYAYRGKSAWANRHMPTKRKQRRPKRNASHETVSFEEFMVMFKQHNPLWFPPVITTPHVDKKELLRKAIPQRHLMEYLEHDGELRKQVLEELLRRI